MTRGELRRAFRQSRIKGKERFVFYALLEHADNKTCEIPDRWQPRSLGDEYWWGISRRTVQRAIPHLWKHGWVSYAPWGDRPRTDPQKQPRTEQRRGHPRNHYRLHEGRPCDCPNRRTTDRSSDADAIATEKQTDGKLLRVDTTTGEVIERQPDAVTVPNRAPEVQLNSAPELHTIERPKVRVPAGQTPVSLRASVGGESEDSGAGRTRRCSVCGIPMHPILPANGYRTHPCCAPAEVSEKWAPGTIENLRRAS